MSANFGTGSTYNPSGTTLIATGGNDGANVVFTAGSTVGPLGNLTIDSGVVNFSTGTTITAASLNMTAGVLTGSDTLDVGGLLTWTDGTMSGPGATVAEGGLALGLAGGGYHVSTLESRTFINQAAANWVGSGEIDLFAGATFVNQSTFSEQTNDEIWSDVGVGESPSGLFDNQGTFVVEGGGQATMESAFDNEGKVEINSGTWELSGAGTSSGDFYINAGDLQLNMHYGIPYTTGQNGAFVSSPQIVGGNAANVTLIDGSQTSPKPLGGNTVIPLATPPYTTFYETGDDTLSSLDMSGGWLTITGTLTVTGPMTWTGGYITGPGTLIVEGGLTLGTGTGDQQETLYGVTLINQSKITLTDKDVFAQGAGATVENHINATIDIQGDAAWDGSDVETIYNQGTLEKTAGLGTTAFNYISLVNDGIVKVSSGTLDLETGGTATGNFTVEAQTTLEFGHSSWAFNSTSNVIGAGTVEFPFAYWSSYFNSNSVYNVTGSTKFESQKAVDFLSGSHVENLGAVTLENGTLDLSSSVLPAISAVTAASLTESSGGILTGCDQLTVSGQTTWTGGIMSGRGTTVTEGSMQPGFLLGASGDAHDVEYLSVRTLEVTGGGTFEPLDTLLQSYGSTFVNTAADTLDVLGGVTWETDIDTTAAIENQGALVVGAGISTATISGGGNFPFLTNPGAIEVLSGTLDLACNGTATGTLQASFTVAAGCTLQFGGDFTLGTGAGIGGPGYVEVPSGNLWFTSGAFSNFVGTMTIDGGTVEYDNSAEAGTLNESSGDLTGPGSLTVTGATVWTGGTMDGVGATIAQGTLQIGLANDANDLEVLDGRTLTNAGTATWAGGGSFSQADGGTVVNEANATFGIANDSTWTSDGTARFANAGSLTKSAGTGTTTLEAALDNTGSVRVQQGTLSLQGGGIVGGSYLVLAGATLAFGSDNVTTISVALPSDFTAGPLNWNGTFTGSAQDGSGSGLASVGVSLFDGQDYYDGTAFESPTAVDNAATLSGGSWTYTILTGNFASDLACAVGSEATDNNGGSEPSTISSILLAPTAPTVRAVGPALGSTAGGTTVTITGLGLANATAVEFGTTKATIISDTNTTIVVQSPAAVAAGSVAVTVTTAEGTSAISPADQFTYHAPPTSSVAALAATTTKTSFTVSWSGSDGTGPGIASYSVYVADNGGAYKSFVTSTTKTSAVFTGQVGHTYAFYSVATDALGFVQPTPKSAQASTKVVAPPLVTVRQVKEITNQKHQVTEVLVTFSAPVNATKARQVGTYHLAAPGKGGSYTANNAKVIKLKSAVYTGATETVALTLAKPLAITKPVQLLVYGTGTAALKDSIGRSIDGDHNGVAGGNAIVILSKGGAKINALARPSGA